MISTLCIQETFAFGVAMVSNSHLLLQRLIPTNPTNQSAEVHGEKQNQNGLCIENSLYCADVFQDSKDLA